MPARLPVHRFADRTLPALLARNAERVPERVFLRFLDPAAPAAPPRDLTFAAFRDLAARAAAFLEAAGVGAGDRVLLLAENSPEWPAFSLAAQALRAEPAGLFASLAAGPAEEIARRVKPRVIFVSTRAQWQKLAPAAADLAAGGLTAVLSLEPLPEGSLPPGVAAAAGDDVFAPGAPALTPARFAARAASVTEDDPFLLLFTSGTTGRQKGVRIVQRAIVSAVDCGVAGVRTEEADLGLHLLPFGHVAGHDQFCLALAQGHALAMISRREDLLAALALAQSLVPEAIALEVVYEDDALAVVYKPAGMVVHPAVGHRTGTLVHALLHRYASLADGGGPERAGIVHRIDKGTSGLLLVARTDEAHRDLARQLEAREVKRIYRALVWGALRDREGRIEAPLGRSARDRTKFAVVQRGGRFAATRYQVVRAFEYASEILLRLETGRTHQIRVHLAHQGHPVFGDSEYGGRRGPLLKLAPTRRAQAALLLSELDHQALHAETLGFAHPVTGAPLEFTHPAPPDFQACLDALECGC